MTNHSSQGKVTVSEESRKLKALSIIGKGTMFKRNSCKTDIFGARDTTQGCQFLPSTTFPPDIKSSRILNDQG